MGREEQEEEREVLVAIFSDELTEVSDVEFRISIQLDVADHDNDDDPPPPRMLLNVRYTDEYPDKAPHLDLLAPSSQEPRYPHFSVADDRDELLAGLGPTIEENLGMAMVFTLVSTLKEAAEQLVAGRRAAAAKVREDAAMAAEREENAKFHGQPVTPEAFLRWRNVFVREMAELRAREEEQRLAEMKKARIKEPVRLTGKQLWQMGLVGKEANEDEEGDAADEGEAGEGEGLEGGEGVDEEMEKLKVGGSQS